MKTCQNCIKSVVDRAIRWGAEDSDDDHGQFAVAVADEMDNRGLYGDMKILHGGFVQGYIEALRDQKKAGRNLIDNETFDAVVEFLRDANTELERRLNAPLNLPSAEEVAKVQYEGHHMTRAWGALDDYARGVWVRDAQAALNLIREHASGGR